MKKLLLSCTMALGALAYAQTYCTPVFEEGCFDGDQIDSFMVSSAGFDHQNTLCSSTSYGDYSATHSITVNAGVPFGFSVTHGYNDQQVRIWADFNNDGTFDTVNELIGSAYSDLQLVSQGNILVPGTVAPGSYRMRIATQYYQEPVPCYNDGYGEAHDYTLVVVAPPSCAGPQTVGVANVTSSTAEVSWSAVSPAPSNGFTIYYNTTGVGPTASTTLDATNSTTSATSPASISNLTPASTYYVWVRSECGASQGVWISGSSFTTACATITPAYTQDFTSFEPPCWEQASGGEPATGPTGTLDYWYSSSGAAVVNLYSDFLQGWLITPVFNLSGSDYTVSLDYYMLDWVTGGAGVLGSDDVVQLVMSPDNGVSWTVLHTWNAASNIPATATQFSYTVTNGTAQTKFALYASDGLVNDPEDNEFFVDNFSVTPASLATVEVADHKKNLQVYPNPFTEFVMISDIKDLKSVKVVDMAGRVVRDITAPSRQLQLSDLKPGMYLLQLQYKDGSVKSAKVLKK